MPFQLIISVIIGIFNIKNNYRIENKAIKTRYPGDGGEFLYKYKYKSSVV